MRSGLVVLLLVVAAATANTVYFKETFDDDTWQSRWVQSAHKSDYGKFELSHGKFYGDAKINKGIKTSQDSKFYAISAEMTDFSNKDKDLIVGFTVKHEQKIDCGGGYLKLMPAGIDQSDFHGDTNYNVMFGPDICGSGTRKVHLIFNYKGQNLECKKTIKAEDDEMTHLYTLIVHPDNTYEVEVDKKNVAKGSLYEDWSFLKAKEIKDPKISKPTDWVDNKEMDDPTDSKPADWDNEPATIADPEAKQPADWDTELDGAWEAPQIDNPEYKGEWHPRRIPNPAYKGEWVHPMIPNPEFEDDKEIYKYDSFKYVGIDIWQVKSGTIFDNIFVGDNKAEFDAFVAATFSKTQSAEKAAFDKIKEAEKKKEEEERKAREEEQKTLDEDEEDEVEDKDEL